MLSLRHEQFLAAQVKQGICQRCEAQKPDVEVHYSYGVIAGVLCRDCAISGYRDHCGLTGHMGTKAEYEEMEGPGSYEPEEGDSFYGEDE